MMTSLAKQLQRLAVPHTQAVLAPDKSRASLLFDPREAATLDREAVFAIGQCGLEELENVEPRFEEFAGSLFSSSSQSWERSMQTAEVNKQLDETIARFLKLLSPYFPLKSSHKALEWLVYRYHVHLYNRDDLVLCILPYHETKMFIRVVQLFPMDKNIDKWQWLESCAKNGVPLPRSALVNHCRQDPGFLSFIMEHVPRFIKLHGAESQQLRAMTSLFACVTLGAIQSEHDVTEKMMSVLVPLLLRGFRSKSLDFKAGCYMVFSHILVTAPIQNSVLTSLLPVLTKHLSAKLSMEGLACLALVYNTQKLGEMPKKSFKHLCKLPGVVLLLAECSKTYAVGGLLRAWLNKLLPAAMATGDGGGYSSTEGSDAMESGPPQYASLLEGVLAEVRMGEALVKDVNRDVLHALVERRSSLMETQEAVTSWQQLAERLLHTLERRFARVFDAVVEEVLTGLQGDDSALSVFQEMMTLTSTPVKYEMVTDASTSLMLALNHPKPQIRALSVRHLGRDLEHTKGLSREFVEEMILSRLKDDSITVLQAVLELKQKLLDAVDGKKLGTALLDLLQRTHNSPKWQPVLQPLLRVFCSLPPDAVIVSVPLTVLPYAVILVSDDEHIQPAVTVMEAQSLRNQAVFKHIRKDWLAALRTRREGATVAGVLNGIVIRGLSRHLLELPQDDFLEQLSLLLSASDGHPVYRFLLLVILGETLTNQKAPFKVHVMTEILKLMTSLIGGDNEGRPQTQGRGVVWRKSLDELLPVWTRDLQDDFTCVPTTCLLWSIAKVIDAVKDMSLGDAMFVSAGDTEALFVVRLFDLLLRQACDERPLCDQWRHLLIQLVEDCLPRPALYRLLCHVWSLDYEPSPGHVSATCRVGSLHVFARLAARDGPRGVAGVLDRSTPVVPCLLVSLLSPREAVRSAALHCLRVLKDTAKDVPSPHQRHLARLVRHEQEIVADALHTPQMMGVIYSKAMRQSSPEKGRQSGSKRQKADDVLAGLTELLQWVNDTNCPLGLKERLLALLAEVPHELVLPHVTRLAGQIVDTPADPAGSAATCRLRGQILAHVMCRFDDAVAEGMTAPSDLHKLLMKVIALERSFGEGLTSLTIALKQLSRSFFHSLPDEECQRELVSCLLQTGATSRDPDSRAAVLSTLKQMKLNGCHISQELGAKAADDVMTVKGKKRSRLTKEMESLSYPRLTLLLEVMQGRKKVKDAEDLAVALFDLLTRLQEEEAEDVEYCKQLVLSCLLRLCSRWSEANPPQKQESFNVEVLVKCIRGSASRQTQQQAILVMSAIAPLFPEYILYNVISVFTFMGSSLLQQDDSYSFQILTRTISTVIPALIKACEDKDPAELRERVHQILRVFVDARRHVPKHRCVLLFRQLLQQVDVGRHLWVVLVLTMESAVRTKDVPGLPDDVADVTEEGRTTVDRDLDFAANIGQQFPCHIQIEAMTRVVGFLQSLVAALPQPSDGGSTAQRQRKKSGGVADVSLVNLATLQPHQLRLLAFHTTRLVATLLAQDTFVTQVLRETTDGKMSAQLCQAFKLLTQETLAYVTKVAKGQGAVGVAGSAKFWKALLHKVYDILDKVNYLLPTSVFLEVTSSLIHHDINSIRRKSLDLLSNKLQQLTLDDLNESEVGSLLDVVQRLETIARTEQPEGESQADVTVIRQMSLYCLKLLCKMLGPYHPAAFKEMFAVVVKLLKAADAVPPPVLGNALLLLAELCSSLKAQAIPHLTTYMPTLLSALRKNPVFTSNELLLVCSLTALQKTVGSLPHFISPYLCDVTLVTCRLSMLPLLTPNAETAGKKSQGALRLAAVKHHLAAGVPPRVLLPVLATALGQLTEKHEEALVPLLQIAQAHLEAISKEDLLAHQGVLYTFFCQALDVRNAKLEWEDKKLDALEEVTLKAFVAMAMRLSENAFRPLFYKLYDWASREDTPPHRRRQLTFCRLCQSLARNFKGLFNLFIGHVMKMLCGLLDRNNTKHGDVNFFGAGPAAGEKSAMLTRCILGCLLTCLQHESEGFVTKEVFAMAMQPLVDQLENFVGGEESYESRIKDHVAGCVSELAVAARDDASWKTVNYQVLLHARNTSPKVRFASLRVVEALARRLGDEYMALLPETVPFLAELMEDDCEDVEHQCRHLISSLEDLLGESLQQYF